MLNPNKVRANLILTIGDGVVAEWCEQMLGASASPSGSHPTDQARSGLGAPRFDPSRKSGE
jgi:hypothetical protein